MKRLLVPAGLVILAAGALAFRLPQLPLRPMHPDEANQAMKAGLLLETGVYQYDPDEHHGPSLYWLTLPSLRLGGAATFAESTEPEYRIVPVLFGVGLILLLLLVADGFGPGPLLLAGLYTAISPAMVYYSRDYIQETLLVFFTLAALGCAWRYFRSRSLFWALATGASLGMMHATKETWVLSAAAMVAGLILMLAWKWWHRKEPPAMRPFLRPLPILGALTVALLVAVALYSSFGSNWNGPLQSVLAYATYWRRGSETGLHTHPWYYYLQLLISNEPPRGFFNTEGHFVALALVGVLASLSRNVLAEPQRTFGRFLSFYTLILTGLYAAIPYKTPWCLLSFLHGMILLAGIGTWAWLRLLPSWPIKFLASLLLVGWLFPLGLQCYTFNYKFPADPRNPYVYAQTPSDTVKLANFVERLALVSPQGHNMVIHVVTPENCWPLPWYFRQFPNVGYPRPGFWMDVKEWNQWRLANRVPPPSLILLSENVPEEVEQYLQGHFSSGGSRGLRPGVVLQINVRQDLWETFAEANK